ncbi:MAG: hypothetical protein E7644_08520 [Ruminococcaceae bacterium]|jgi:hypothetical protein|nr:hypothetical protein [Oscillospiraceae bacterium]
MTKKNRIEYLICTLSVVVTGFLIYGLLGSIEPLINDSKLHSFLLFGCLGGFGFSAIISTIILSVGFFKKRGLIFKIVASVLWPITFAACVYAGMLSYIPYQIFNIVRLISIVKEEKKQSNPETNTEDL